MLFIVSLTLFLALTVCREPNERGMNLPENDFSTLQVHSLTDHDDVRYSITGRSILRDLMENGVALVMIPSAKKESQLQQHQQPVVQAAFAIATKTLDHIKGCTEYSSESSLCQVLIDEETDSAHATGYHRLGCMSARYNAHREGFVFSDGCEFDVRGFPEFRKNCAALQRLMHATAVLVLNIICQHLQLPLGWFDKCLGPTHNNSQWHIKRYLDIELKPNHATIDQNAVREWLPSHCDPSLISLVVLNRPGKNEGSCGLQYYTRNAFVDVPWSGHNVATLFVGSVLQHLTGGYFSACRHRVVHTKMEQERMTATLFVRPAPTAILALPPSLVLCKANCKVKGNLTFSQWNAKVARNYEKTGRKHYKARNEKTAF